MSRLARVSRNGRGVVATDAITTERLSKRYGATLALDELDLTVRAGEVFGYLAHAHPFLEGNGRTILTVFADLSRRAGFHVEWEAIDKDQFLEALTRELLEPGKMLDELVLPYSREGVLSVDKTASRLRVNFKRDEVAPAPGSDERG